MSSLQIQRWTAKEVADWLRGLDDSLHTYVQAFLDKGYTGERLLRVTPQDLDELKIDKLGHQEILLEAIELLKNINYDQPDENLQIVLLRLNTKATNLKNELNKIIPATRDAAQLQLSSLSIPANILLRIADTVTAAKTLISWLDRPPFAKGEDDFHVVRREVLQHALDITHAVQRSTDVHSAVTTMMTSSQDMMEITDSTIKQTTDPLVISPTFIDEVTIKKKHQEEELGLFLKTSSIDGVHFITGTKDQSAAGVVGKVHSGDEVLCVNLQTVVAWEHKKVIELVKENPMTVTLTLRKRPKNLSTPGQYQRVSQNSFPIYGPRIRPVVQEKQHVTRSRKNSDPTTLRVVMRDKEETCGSPRGAHSDNETTEPLEATFDEGRKIARRETAGADVLRRHPGSSRSSKRHSDGRPRSLPENIEEAITNTAVEEWLRTPSSSDSQQTPSPNADTEVCMKKEEEKKQKSVRINTNNNTSYVDDRKLSTMSTISISSTISTASSQVSEVKVQRRPKKRRYTVNKHVSCIDLGPGECEGYIWMRKKQRHVSTHKWSELWFVLKEYVLYYYKDKKDVKAKGVICLPGYKIQEAPEIKKHKNAFKAIHEGTDPIFFRAQSENDRTRWLGKLGLAAIMVSENQERVLRQSKVFKDGLLKGAEGRDLDANKPMPNIEGFHDQSESDGEDDSKSETGSVISSPTSETSSITSSVSGSDQTPDKNKAETTPRKKPPLTKDMSTDSEGSAPSSPTHENGDVFKQHYDSFKGGLVGIKGLEKTKGSRIIKRLSQKRPEFFRSQLKVAQEKQNDRLLEKRALERTLTDRQHELQSLEAFFKGPINHDRVQEWKKQNEELLTHTIDRLNKDIHKEEKTRDSSSDGTSGSIEGSNEGLEQISGMARSSLVLGPARPRVESDCSETSI